MLMGRILWVGRRLWCSLAEDSGVGHLFIVFIDLGGNLTQKPQIRKEISKISAGGSRRSKTNTLDTKSTDQNQEELTKSRDRFEAKFRAIFAIFYFWWKREIRGEILGNQKLLIPDDEGKPPGLARSSRIPVGKAGASPGERRGGGCGSEEHEEPGEYSHTQHESKADCSHYWLPVQFNPTKGN